MHLQTEKTRLGHWAVLQKIFTEEPESEPLQLGGVLLEPEFWRPAFGCVTISSASDQCCGPGTAGIPGFPEDASEAGVSSQIRAALHDVFMLFIAVESGSDSEIAAAGLIAQAARSMNILTITASPRSLVASAGQRGPRPGLAIGQLSNFADSLLVLDDGGPAGGFGQALRRTCNLFAQAILGASPIIPEFEDVRIVIEHGGISFMGEGEGNGPGRAGIAAGEAIARLTEIGVDMRDIPGLLCFITVRSADRILREVREVKSALQTLLSKSIDLVFGTIDDEAMGESLRVTLVATGLHDGRSDTSLF